ncbi:MAG: hypothetical protein QOC98_1712, partial [Frankiaceae bacterium]|nr:hypothetical protein [Frankiaceae bacterium]
MRRGTAPAALVLTAIVLTACSSPSSTPSAAGPTRSASSTPSASSAAPTPTPAAPKALTARLLPWRLPYAVGREAVFGLGRRAVVAGGLVAGDSSTDGVFTLDLETGSTRTAAPLAVPVHDTAGALAGGRLLVVGGGNATEQDVVQATSAGRHTWSVVGRLPQARSDLTALRIGRRVVVLGGYDGTSVALPDLVATTDGADWLQVGTLPVPVRYAAGVTLAGAGYLFGGERGGIMQRAVQRIDARGRASVVARLPVPLGHAVAVRFGARILVAGGRLTQTRLTDRMWWFDP